MKRKAGYFILLLILSVVLGYFLVYLPGNGGSGVKNTVRYGLINNSKTDPNMLFLNAWRLVKGKYYDTTLHSQDWSRWKTRYIKQIKTDEDAYVAINSMLASLDDPYSKFMSENEYTNQNIDIDAKLSGIGVTLVTSSGKAIVIGVIDGTPAMAADLRPGDILTTVDGVDTHGLSIEEIVKLVRGPAGTDVNIKLVREGQKLEKSITRAEIHLKNINSKRLEHNIGYIQINSFMSSEIDSEFIDALANIEGSKGIILDLRGNMGGLLPNAIYIANIFLPKGNIVSVVDRNGSKTPIAAQTKSFDLKVPLVVLVDGASASASEILSGALKDYNRATIVGEKTFGKGLIQKVFPLPNKTGMNLTIASYLTPKGHDIHKKGIEPDFHVAYPPKDFLAGHDVQLEKAIDVLNNM